MSDNKITPMSQNVDTFIAAIENPKRRADAVALDQMFRRVTGWVPQIRPEAKLPSYLQVVEANRGGLFGCGSVIDAVNARPADGGIAHRTGHTACVQQGTAKTVVC